MKMSVAHSIGALVTVMLCGSAAFAGDRVVGAVIFPFTFSNVDITDAQKTEIRAYLATRLTQEKVYRVVPEDQIKRDLAGQKLKSWEDCNDQSCRMDLTRALSGDKAISVSVVREEQTCRVTADLFDIEQEVSEAAADTEAGCSYLQIKSAMLAVAGQLSGKVESRGQGRAAAVGGGVVTPSVNVDRGENIVNTFTDQTGLVFVNTDPPKASIFINGKPAGKAPYQDALMVGRYIISASLNSYYHDAASEIVLTTQGATVELRLPPAFGELRLSSQPSDAEVLIDDRPAGRTPYVDPLLKSGRYRVEVRKDLYKSEVMQIEMVDGGKVERSLILAEDSGGLFVTSDPQGASIIIDGQPTGVVTPFRFPRLAPGLHIVTLDMDGYGRLVENARVAVGVETEVSTKLVPKMGMLTVMTQDAGGSPCQGVLTIDGVVKGPTPWKGNLVATMHAVSAKCGRGGKSETVMVEHNSNRVLTLKMDDSGRPENVLEALPSETTEAKELRGMAREAGKNGDYIAAINMVKRARELDPGNKLDDAFIAAWQKKLNDGGNDASALLEQLHNGGADSGSAQGLPERLTVSDVVRGFGATKVHQERCVRMAKEPIPFKAQAKVEIAGSGNVVSVKVIGGGNARGCLEQVLRSATFDRFGGDNMRVPYTIFVR